MRLEVNIYVFFFKQKTAYEMCGRDWSSDVCSSDLRRFHSHTKVIQVYLIISGDGTASTMTIDTTNHINNSSNNHNSIDNTYKCCDCEKPRAPHVQGSLVRLTRTQRHRGAILTGVPFALSSIILGPCCRNDHLWETGSSQWWASECSHVNSH